MTPELLLFLAALRLNGRRYLRTPSAITDASLLLWAVPAKARA